MLTSAMSSRVLSLRSDDRMSGVLPATPTATRGFAPSDQIAFLAEIYDNDREGHEVDISTSILTAAGKKVFTASERRSSEEIEAAGDSYGVVYEVPLAAFEPGLYILRVEALNPARPEAPVARDVQFRVGP
jgi:hypothetical protein